MRYLPLPLLMALCIGMSSQQLVHAQPTATIYNTVSQPPHLPGTEADPAFQALEEALVRNFRYPTGVQPQQVNGARYIEVEVTQTGKVTTIEFDQSSGSGNIPTTVEAAMRTALHQLPVLAPARYAREPVESKLNIRWSFSRSLSGPDAQMRVSIEQLSTGIDAMELSGARNPPVAFDPTKTYTYVDQMPRLPTGTGQTSDITAAVQQALVLPANAQEGRIFVSFAVDKQGKVGEEKIVKGLDTETDAAVLAAVRRLPTFLPGKQGNQLVRVSLTLPISVYIPSKHPTVKPAKH